MEADFGRDFLEAVTKSSKPRTEYVRLLFPWTEYVLTFKIYGQEPQSLRVWKSLVETQCT